MTMWLDLLGTEVKFAGKKYRTRIIETGREKSEAIILLHGGGGHAETYARNVVPLGENFHTIAYDLLWHGLSSKPEFDDQYVLKFLDQVIDLMDDLGIEKANFEGLSFGGFITMLLALNYPKRVGKIVLNTTWGVVYQKGSISERPEASRATIERSKSSVLEPDREKVRKRLELLFADPSQVTDELVDVRLKLYSIPETQQALIKYYEYLWGDATNPYLLSEEKLSQIRVPTMVLWTDKNPGLGEDAGRRLSRLIPGASFHLIKGAAHWPQWEKPREHDEAVRRFLIG
jgi:pimeloyl-ACP methyl ester carboxylesterase